MDENTQNHLLQQTPSVTSANQEASADWKEFTAADGRRYYYNKRTKQSSWEKPPELMSPLERADVSTLWKELTTADGKKYYYNKDTKQSQWTIPKEFKLAREHAEKEASRRSQSPQVQPVASTFKRTTLLKAGIHNNVLAVYNTNLLDGKDFKNIIKFLKRSRIHKAISTKCTPYYSHQWEFWDNAKLVKLDNGTKIVSKVKGNEITVSTPVIRNLLGFGDNDNYPITLHHIQVRGCFARCGYSATLKGKAEISKACLSPQYKYLAHVLNRCISGRKAGFDKLNEKIQSAFAALVLNANYNFSGLVYHYFKENLTSKSKYLIYARFLQIILNDQAPDLDKDSTDVIQLEPMSKIVFSRMKQHKKQRKKQENKPKDRELICHLAKEDYECPKELSWRGDNSDSEFEEFTVQELMENEDEVEVEKEIETDSGSLKLNDEEDEEAYMSKTSTSMKRKRKSSSEHAHDLIQRQQQQRQQRQQTERMLRENVGSGGRSTSFRPQMQSASLQTTAPVAQVSMDQFNTMNSLLMQTLNKVMTLETEMSSAKKTIAQLEDDNKKLNELAVVQDEEIRTLNGKLDDSEKLRLADSKKIRALEYKVSHGSTGYTKRITTGRV